MNLNLKQNILQSLQPKEAYSLHILDALSSLEILNLIDHWLTIGLESESLFQLYSIDPTDTNAIKSLFTETLNELNILKPNKYNASKDMVKIIFKKMINYEVDIEEATKDIYNIEMALEHNYNNKEKYFGNNLKLEHYLMWDRELSDCRDGSMIFYYTDLSRDEAYEKIKEELLNEAKKWLLVNYK